MTFELREHTPVWLAVAAPVAAVAVSLLLCSVLILWTGQPVLNAYRLLLGAAFGSGFGIAETLTRATPLILTGLAFAIPARIGLTMIGGEGALVLGGFASAAIAIPLVSGGVPPLVTLPIMAATGIITGGLWVGFTGWLKYARGVNETIASLLLSYIAIAIMNFFVEGALRRSSPCPLFTAAVIAALSAGLATPVKAAGIGAAAAKGQQDIYTLQSYVHSSAEASRFEQSRQDLLAERLELLRSGALHRRSA